MVRPAWAAHRDHLSGNYAYANAIAALAAAAITQRRLPDLLTVLASGAVAVLRALRNDPPCEFVLGADDF
jgi:hypothetical protein